MASEGESRDTRREEIRQRLGAIGARLEELKTEQHDDRSRVTSRERAESARRNLGASQAAAGQAIAASVRAFRRAAQAHERAAAHHERAAATGYGDKDEHERRAAVHRIAQVRDVQRADRAESLVPDGYLHKQDGTDLGQGPASPSNGS